MPTSLADVTSQGKGEILRQWLLNLGVTPSSLGEGELNALLADAAASMGAQGSFDLSPANAVAATLSRPAVSSQAIALASGTIGMAAVYLTKGQVINNIVVFTGSQAGATLTHQWAVLCTGPASAPVPVAASVDGTSAAIGANAAITFAMTSAYTVATSGIYYIGVMVANGGTQPNFAGAVAGNVATATVPPIIGGTSSTGQTTVPALGTALTTITPTVNILYCYIT
jgi:hypothetical protein